jgi:hypothetical protein
MSLRKSCWIEWDVREIDEHGDAINVLHFDTYAEAVVCALASDQIAAVVEKHDLKDDAFETWLTVATGIKGHEALSAGCWR